MGRRRRKKKRKNSDKPSAPPLTDELGEQIVEWAGEAADAHGLDLWDVVARPNWVLQVFVDQPGVDLPGEGVTVDECADVSRFLEGFLDNDERVWPNYTLEVSSPGLERKLENEGHFELSVGRDVRIVVHDPIEKRNVFEGRLIEFTGDEVAVECGPDDVVRIDWENIAKARLTYDFSE
jgi:ribosome maturation factor RimP